MMNNRDDQVLNYLKKTRETMSEVEKHVLKHVTERRPISRNVHAARDEQMTFGQRLADRVAAFGGSWPFIILFLCVLAAWIALNTWLLLQHRKAFDPYPFILLNLVLSMLAAIQAPVIMMSQNRQAVHDRLDAEHDYEVNLKAELEIMQLHEKLDELREQQWKQLMDVQQEQIDKLEALEQAIRGRQTKDGSQPSRQ